MVDSEDVIKAAKAVNERASDLRALELLGVGPGRPGAIPGFTGDYVAEWGDSNEAAWKHWDKMNPGAFEDNDISVRVYGGEFDYIPEMFTQMCFHKTGHHTDHDKVMSQLDKASLALAEDGEQYIERSEIKDIVGLNDGWSGSFAVAFRSKFAGKLPYHIPNQKQVINELSAAVKGHWNIVEGVRESLHSIAKDTEKALIHNINEHYDGYEDEVDDLKAVGLGLAIAGTALAIFGVAAAAPSGGGSLALSLAIMGAIKSGGTLAKTAAGGIEREGEVDKKELSIKGDTLDAIIDSMNEEIKQVHLGVIEEERKQAEKIQESIDSIEAQLKLKGSASDNPDDNPAYKLVPYRLAWADELPESDKGQLTHTD